MKDHNSAKPTNDELAMAVANTPYPYVIPRGVVKMFIKLRSDSYNLLSTWASDGKWKTTFAGSEYSAIGALEGLTIFLKSPGTDQVAEIELWS